MNLTSYHHHNSNSSSNNSNNDSNNHNLIVLIYKEENNNLFIKYIIYFLYNSLNLLVASKHASLGAKALIRRKLSPPGPKPAPGIVTT